MSSVSTREICCPLGTRLRDGTKAGVSKGDGNSKPCGLCVPTAASTRGLGTGDDLRSRQSVFGYAGTIPLSAVHFDGAGPDGQWDTADDSIESYETQELIDDHVERRWHRRPLPAADLRQQAAGRSSRAVYALGRRRPLVYCGRHRRPLRFVHAAQRRKRRATNDVLDVGQRRSLVHGRRSGVELRGPRTRRPQPPDSHTIRNRSWARRAMVHRRRCRLRRRHDGFDAEGSRTVGLEAAGPGADQVWLTADDLMSSLTRYDTSR